MMKQIISGRKRPNPLAHMLIWGAGSGTILALLYFLFLGGLGSAGIMELLRALITPDLWIFALQLGGIPGAILGFLMGLVLWTLSLGFRQPFTRAEMQRHRYPVYFVIGTLTTILGYALTILLLGMDSFSYLGVFLAMPPIIAGIASAYAAHRYMFRLRLWSEQNYGIQKEKDKNFEHLEDKRNYEESADEDEARSQSNQK